MADEEFDLARPLLADVLGDDDLLALISSLIAEADEDAWLRERLADALRD